ncbi:hypothetical protein C356_01810 [Cryptococcus neoformans c45]|nr:hypothetical protein C356_01810 [Cryptococcus neoformans var. grubii c45]
MRMTGDIAGIWCPHGICLAYQVMPTSEGRDDFFSPLKYFFLVPPKVIVYDLPVLSQPIACCVTLFTLPMSDSWSISSMHMATQLARGPVVSARRCSTVPTCAWSTQVSQRVTIPF